MTAKAKATIDHFPSEPLALRAKVEARLQTLSYADRLELLVSEGVLKKKGKLTPTYRPKRVAAWRPHSVESGVS